MRSAASVLACLFCASCSASLAPRTAPSDGAPAAPAEGDPSDGGSGSLGGATLAPGGPAGVTANELNLRSAIGTTATVEAAMPCGATVSLISGPSTTPAPGWWNVSYSPATGASMNG